MNWSTEEIWLPPKMLIYQMTRITQERWCLRHDDRLDALAIAVSFFTEQMGRDEAEGERAHTEEMRDRELAKFMESASLSAPSKPTWVSHGFSR